MSGNSRNPRQATGESPKVLPLSGPARDRGRAHGESMRDEIRELHGSWEALVARATGRPIAELVAEFRGRTRFDLAIERFTPGLLDEMKGIAEGAGVDADSLYMFNCTDENQWVLEHLGHGLELPEGRGCSSLALAGPDHPTPLVAQNFDIPGSTDGYELLLDIEEPESGRRMLLFTLAGMVGMIGVSDAPVGVVNNSLRQLNVRVDGLPVNMMVRGLLAQDGLPAAERFLRETPHATGHNYILGGVEGASMWECSAGAVVEVEHEAPGVALIHTNHPLASEDRNPDPRFDRDRSESSTQLRLEALERDVRRAPSALDVGAVKRALSSHDDPDNPVCRHLGRPASNFTAASVVYELAPDPVLHLAAGPPCITRFGRYGFGSGDASA